MSLLHKRHEWPEGFEPKDLNSLDEGTLGQAGVWLGPVVEQLLTFSGIPEPYFGYAQDNLTLTSPEISAALGQVGLEHNGRSATRVNLYYETSFSSDRPFGSDESMHCDPPGSHKALGSNHPTWFAIDPDHPTKLSRSTNLTEYEISYQRAIDTEFIYAARPGQIVYFNDQVVHTAPPRPKTEDRATAKRSKLVVIYGSDSQMN